MMAPMPTCVLLCTDGSELATEALTAGLRVIAPADRVVVATAIDPPDPSLVIGTGMASGVMTPDQAQTQHEQQIAYAGAIVADAIRDLGLNGAESRTVEGVAGPALCELAAEIGATVMVLGTRGRGGLRRAVLGSVSDHVVRNAPCPVVTVTS